MPRQQPHADNSNDYDYVDADPVNSQDLDGRVAIKLSEKLVCAAMGVRRCARAAAITVMVFKAYSGTSRRQDATRHFVWQAMLTIYVGAPWARLIGNAHEAGETSRGSRNDLYNNAYARRWVARNGWIRGLATNVGLTMFSLGRIGNRLSDRRLLRDGRG